MALTLPNARRKDAARDLEETLGMGAVSLASACSRNFATLSYRLRENVNGIVITPRDSLQAAIRSAGRLGQRIVLTEGLWDVRSVITVDRAGVHIVGQGRSTRLLGAADLAATDSMLDITATNVTLENLYIASGDTATRLVRLAADDATVRGVTFFFQTGGPTEALRVIAGADECLVTGCRFQNGWTQGVFVENAATFNLVADNFAESSDARHRGADSNIVDNWVNGTVTVV